MKAMTHGTRIWQKRSYLAGLILGAAGVGVLLWPAQNWLHAKGPMNTGHAELQCPDCHLDAPGTVRQQLQANMRFILGMRQTPADFVHRPVVNETCLGCHERPNDRHPVYRFLEPRFAKARATLAPHRCVSCHLEHEGRRVTLREVGYCVTCHKETRLRKEPVDVPHDRLIALAAWDTCLGCHDFHGNHVRKTEKTVDKRIPAETLRDYFGGGRSPYGGELRYKARKEARHG